MSLRNMQMRVKIVLALDNISFPIKMFIPQECEP